MFRLTRKELWAHRLRFALTGLAVVLGVGFLSGTQILTDTMGKTFSAIFEDANEGVDVVVRRTAAIEGDFTEDVRERVDASTPHRSATSTVSTRPSARSKGPRHSSGRAATSRRLMPSAGCSGPTGWKTSV